MLSDYPKLECPFVRRTFPVNRKQWKKYGRKLQLRVPEVYLVVDEVNPGYEWVFEDEDTFAVEKLDGSNVKLRTEGGRLVELQNRKNVIDPLQILKGKTFLVEGVLMSAAKGYVQPDGVQAGELIGPKVQGNPYRLDLHEWYPFERAIQALRYRSFHEHARTFDNWSEWFEKYLFSRYFTKRASKMGWDDKVMAEGVVFYNLKRKAAQQTWRAKLRRDMFDWHFGHRIGIVGYAKDPPPPAE